jgi:uncharacterized protein (DUF1697 family)
VRTHIQSGNVLFESSIGRLEKGGDVSKKDARLCYYAHVLIRTKKGFRRLVQNIPLANKDCSKLYVVFLLDESRSLPLERIGAARRKGKGFLFWVGEGNLF